MWMMILENVPKVLMAGKSRTYLVLFGIFSKHFIHLDNTQSQLPER